MSAIIDNVPLVAATMGMYDLTSFPQDSEFWQLVAFCAGTGGSMLIIGSAAGVAFMGMEKIDFFWYFRKVKDTFFFACVRLNTLFEALSKRKSVFCFVHAGKWFCFCWLCCWYSGLFGTPKRSFFDPNNGCSDTISHWFVSCNIVCFFSMKKKTVQK